MEIERVTPEEEHRRAVRSWRRYIALIWGPPGVVALAGGLLFLFLVAVPRLMALDASLEPASASDVAWTLFLLLLAPALIEGAVLILGVDLMDKLIKRRRR